MARPAALKTAPAVESRTVLLGQRLVPYSLRRSRRRSLGMLIDARGLTVSIPLHCGLHETEAFLRSRAGWISEKLAEWQSRPQAVAVQVADGMQISVLGAPCQVRVLPGANKTQWFEGLPSKELRVLVRPGADPKPIMLRGLQRYALGYFRGRLEEFTWGLQQIAPHISLPALHLTNARTRWGSCSTRSGIRLNWRLIHVPNALIDYVVAHELAHLLEMNHSPRFWAVVEQLYPGFEEARDALREANRWIPAW